MHAKMHSFLVQYYCSSASVNQPVLCKCHFHPFTQVSQNISLAAYPSLCSHLCLFSYKLLSVSVFKTKPGIGLTCVRVCRILGLAFSGSVSSPLSSFPFLQLLQSRERPHSVNTPDTVPSVAPNSAVADTSIPTSKQTQTHRMKCRGEKRRKQEGQSTLQ